MRDKQDKGVAGLTILLSVVVMLFVIGLLVFIFSLMGGELQTATSETGTVSVNETLTLTVRSIKSPAITHATDCGFTGWTPTAVYNDTDGGNQTLTKTTHYTVNADGTLTNVTYWATPLKVTYTYTWGGESCNTINETTVSISSVTDWFDIFLVITAMVVLILLTVIIITAIRGSGLIAGGDATSGGVGTA